MLCMFPFKEHSKCKAIDLKLKKYTKLLLDFQEKFTKNTNILIKFGCVILPHL